MSIVYEVYTHIFSTLTVIQKVSFSRCVYPPLREFNLSLNIKYMHIFSNVIILHAVQTNTSFDTCLKFHFWKMSEDGVDKQ